jgi:hypothetical protein
MTSQNVFNMSTTDTGVISAREMQYRINTWPGYPGHVIVPSTHEMLSSSSTTTHMEAPNTDAANTLLKRPRLAQCSAYAVWCSSTPVPCTTLFDSRSISLCVLYQSATTALYWLRLQSILPSWSLAASRSAQSLHHNTSSCYSCHVLLYTAIRPAPLSIHH